MTCEDLRNATMTEIDRQIRNQPTNLDRSSQALLMVGTLRVTHSEAMAIIIEQERNENAARLAPYIQALQLRGC